MHVKKLIVKAPMLVKSIDELMVVNRYLPYIENRSDIIRVDIPPTTARKWVGDFYGLMHELGLVRNDYLATLHLNNLTDPSQYDGSENFVLIYRSARLQDILTLERMRPIV